MIGECIFSGLFRKGPWWLIAVIALLWCFAGWFVGFRLWNRLFPCYLTFTDTGLSIGKVHYALKSIESVSMPLRKRIRIWVYLKVPLKPVRITLWETENEELRNRLKHWSIVHGISYMEPS
jgi:hypothetical protein